MTVVDEEMRKDYILHANQYHQKQKRIWYSLHIQHCCLRKQLFRGAPHLKTHYNDNQLVTRWSAYLILNIVLPKPGPYLALAELHNMITSCHTPCYNPSRKHDKAIPPRKLSDLKFAKLQELLPIYLTKLQNISQMQNDTFKDIKLQLQPLKALMRKQTASSTTKRNRMSDHDTNLRSCQTKKISNLCKR